MRVVFIGASHWHLPLYLEPALAVPGVELVGMADPDAGKGPRAGRAFRLRGG